MKIRHGYVLRNIMDEYIVMPVGSEMNSFSNLLVLNESSAFLWNCLINGVDDEAELAEKLTYEYDVDHKTATEDCAEFVSQLREMKLLAE